MARIYVYCWDGTTFDLLRPWMERGRLPHLASCIRSGASGEVETVFPPVTATAWSSFITGTNPAAHGILDMTLLTREGRLGEIAASSASLDGRTLWSLANQKGLETLVINLPPTWPPRPIQGAMVSDFLAPKGDRRLTYPPQLLEELERELGPIRLHFREVYRPGGIDRVVQEAEEIFDYGLAVARHLTSTRSWDFAIHHVFGTDRLQHELWHVLDPTHPAHDPREAEAHGERVIGFFERVDAAIPQIREWLGPEGTLIVASDHGFGPVTRFLVFNAWLLENGFLRLRGSAVSRLRATAHRLGLTPDFAYRAASKIGLSHLRHSRGIGTRHRLLALLSHFFLSFRDVDWTRTVAYSKGNYGQIYLNLRGREPEGIVRAGEEAREICTRIIAGLRDLRNPDDGSPLLDPIWRKEEIYAGAHLGDAPEILFLPRDMRWKALGTMDFITNRFVIPAHAQSGDHRMNGIAVLCGPPIRAGVSLGGVRIVDMAPTILHLLGLPVHRAMEGRVLTEALTEEYRSSRPVRLEDYGPETGAVPGPSDRDHHRMAEQLRELGYLG